ncbi:MAG: hypothetical protein JWN85_3463 [Gammaproteobacteria bacterium]|nr:hypothetical protein [Gammaproteobacteria bacterium]
MAPTARCRRAGELAKLSVRFLAIAVLLLSSYGAPKAAPPQEKPPRMVVVTGKDLTGTVYKKLGLPNQQYCWDTCLKEDKCSGVRWGVIEGDTAGLCLLITGPLAFKEPVQPKTEDGKAIHVTVSKKQRDTAAGGV